MYLLFLLCWTEDGMEGTRRAVFSPSGGIGNTSKVDLTPALTPHLDLICLITSLYKGFTFTPPHTMVPELSF